MANNNSPNDSAFDNAFDDISRILASPMPRRQALKLIVATIGSAALVSLGSSSVLGDANNEKTSGLKIPVNNISLQNQELFRVINLLRQEYGVPVSLIQAKHNPNLNIQVDKGTVKDVLNQIVQQNSSYEWKVIKSRIVVFPSDPKYNQPVKGLIIEDVARYKAANQYNDFLAAHVSGFEDFGGVVLTGSANLPEYSTPISFNPQGTVISRFVELLGNDASAVFSVQQFPGEKFITTFEQVKQPQTSHTLKTANCPARLGEQLILDAAPLASSSVCRPYSIAIGSYNDVCGSSACACDPCPNIDPNLCGVKLCYGILSFAACTGDDCSSASLSEGGDVQTPGCGVTSLKLGAHCPTQGNNFVCCWDHYGPVQVRPQDFPSGCTLVSTQTFSMGSTSEVLKKQITYTIGVANGQCSDSGGITDVVISSHDGSDCCGNGDTGSPKVLCNHTSQVCLNNDVCCDKGTAHTCNHTCCRPSSASYGGEICAKDPSTGLQICCLATQVCAGICCPSGQGCSNGICCPTGQTNCGGTCCANPCCNNVCCAKGQTCAGGVCCGAPTPQARMSHAQILQGRYATDDLSLCCQPGQVPCASTCCDAGSVCCSGSCCAGTCDDTGACITNNENK